MRKTYHGSAPSLIWTGKATKRHLRFSDEDDAGIFKSTYLEFDLAICVSTGQKAYELCEVERGVTVGGFRQSQSDAWFSYTFINILQQTIHYHGTHYHGLIYQENLGQVCCGIGWTSDTSLHVPRLRLQRCMRFT